jgi:hypothetical protein
MFEYRQDSMSAEPGVPASIVAPHIVHRIWRSQYDISMFWRAIYIARTFDVDVTIYSSIDMEITMI